MAAAPGIFILLALIATIQAYRHHWKWRHGLLFVTFLAYLLSIRIGANMLVRPLKTWFHPPQHVSGDVLLMLGNGSVGDVPDIGGTGQPSGTMAKSMLTTFRPQGLQVTVYPTLYRRPGTVTFGPVMDLVPSSANLDDSAAAMAVGKFCF